MHDVVAGDRDRLVGRANPLESAAVRALRDPMIADAVGGGDLLGDADLQIGERGPEGADQLLCPAQSIVGMPPKASL